MKSSLKIYFPLLSFIVLTLLLFSSQSYAVSLDVAVIDSLSGINGGSFPTTTSGPTGNFNSFIFTIMPVANVSAGNLASFDTVLLNMQSSGMNCNSNSLSASQKSDLGSFVNGGGKLIIYDSECSAVDYSWLPFPFTTNNPGANGATGTLTIDQNTDLASAAAGNTFIDAALLASQTDAAGDMNVMSTHDPNWCLDMSGTNSSPAQGPVLVHAQRGSGLIIWNGLDIDYMGTGTAPDSSTPDGNLAKLWLQALQATGPLPCGVTVVTPAASIPTMTEWGMLVMSLLLGGTAVFFMRRKRKA